MEKESEKNTKKKKNEKCQLLIKIFLINIIFSKKIFLI